MTKAVSFCLFASLGLSAAAQQQSAPPAPAQDDIKAILLKMQQEMDQLRTEVKNIRTLQDETAKQYIQNEIKDALKKNPALLLNSNIVKGKLTGDLRLRYQNERATETDTRSAERDRFRTRLRLGYTFETDEAWEIGVGIATGDTADGRSTNDTHGDQGAFDQARLKLDYAYAKRAWDMGSGHEFVLTAGQSPAVFLVNEMFMDSDIRPAGITLQWNSYLNDDYKDAKLKKDAARYFATAGAYTVMQVNAGREDNDAMLYVLQGGYRDKNLLAALGYLHTNDQFRTAGAAMQQANGAGTIGRNKNEDDFSFNIITAELAYKFQINEDWSIRPIGAFAYNFGADIGDSKTATDRGQVQGVSDSEPLAATLGSELKWTDWTFGYNYVYIEANSLPWWLTNDDFGIPANGGVNSKGHVLTLKYAFSKNVEFKLSQFMSDAIDSTGVNHNGYDKTQVDVIWKF